MKGLSQMITHSFLVAFSLTILLFVVITFGDVKSDFELFTEKISGNDICSLLKQSVERISSLEPENIDILTNETFGVLTIDLPEKIGNKKYRIFFEEKIIKIETEKQTFECKINIDVNLTGSASGGKIKIKRILGQGVDKVMITN